MPKLLEICHAGDPILRIKASPVAVPTGIQELIDDLIYTCDQVDGVGIAAPQIGVSLRLFIVASKPSKRYPHAPDGADGYY